MTTEPNYTLQDYFDAMRRRRKLALMIALPILLLAGAVASLLDDQYTASTRIDIDLQGANVPTLEPIQLTTYADQYISRLGDRAMSSDSLRPLANETGLFPPNMAELSESRRIRIIRDSVDVLMVTQPVMTGGRSVDLITGFRVNAVSINPQFAFRVSEYVGERFLEADRNARTQRASSTSTFLREQMSKTERDILNFEQQVADFKVDNACCLPELMDLNLSVIQRTERDIESLQPRIRTLEKDRSFKLSQIEEISQQVVSTSRLADLEAEYLRLVANYGSEHPDVARVRREITAITGASAGASGGEAYELVNKRIQLAEAQQRYSDEHPDIIRLKREIAILESQQSPGPGVNPNQARLLENPRYLQLRAELNDIETELAEQRRRVPELRTKIEDYENRLIRTPQIESEYQALNRKLESARDNFQNLQNRLVIANQTEALESTEIGARLTKARHASVPSTPSGPPRVALMIVAAFLAGTFAVGAMLVAELTDATIRSRKDIESIMDMVPLATIPVIENVSEHAARTRQTYLIAGGTLLAITIIALINWGGIL